MKKTKEIKKICNLQQEIIDLLSLDPTFNNGIYLGKQNEEHIKKCHNDAYCKYFKDLTAILKNPDYVGLNPKDGSIEIVKEYIINNEYVKVAVRLSGNGKYFVRSMYVLSNNRVHNFITKGTLKKC